jgi:hypothetical protein
MPSLQYLLDTICSKLTVDALNHLINRRLAMGQFPIDEIIPSIQAEDRSLDRDSARLLAEAALEAMARSGVLTVDGNLVRPAN